MQKSKPSLLKRNSLFRNFICASGVSLLGTQIFDFAIPLYVIQRTNSVIALSLAAVALNLPFFLMAPITGYSVDNFNKRKIMYSSDIAQIILLLFLFAYDFLPQDLPVWPVLLTVFAAKTFMIMFETVATFQLIPALVGKSDLSEANTWFLSMQRLIQIIAPLSAGTLMTLFGVRLCILANVVSFGATLFFVYRMKNLNELIENDEELRAPKKKMTVGAVLDSFIDSIVYVWKSPLFKPFIIMMFIWNASPLIHNTPSVTYYFTEVQKFTPAQYGMVGSLLGFIGIFGFIGAGYIYERFRFYNTFVGAGLLLAGSATVALLFFNSPWLFAFIFSFSRVGASILSLGTFVLRQTNIPRSKMGGINACLRMFFMSSTPLSSLAQGFMISHLGIAPTFTIGAICLWGTVWFALRVASAYSETEKATARKAA